MSYKNLPEVHTLHYLNNSMMIINQLENTFKEKGFQFLRNYAIENYTFDFYFPDSKIGIEIDSYAHELSDIYNLDAPKKLSIPSLGVTVLRITDYQILTDVEDIIRTIKYHIQTTKRNRYVV